MIHWCDFFNVGKEELQSTQGSGEATGSRERPECEAPDNKCNEMHAAVSAGSVTDSVPEDPDVRKPGTPTSISIQKWQGTGEQHRQMGLKPASKFPFVWFSVGLFFIIRRAHA